MGGAVASYLAKPPQRALRTVEQPVAMADQRETGRKRDVFGKTKRHPAPEALPPASVEIADAILAAIDDEDLTGKSFRAWVEDHLLKVWIVVPGVAGRVRVVESLVTPGGGLGYEVDGTVIDAGYCPGEPGETLRAGCTICLGDGGSAHYNLRYRTGGPPRIICVACVAVCDRLRGVPADLRRRRVLRNLIIFSNHLGVENRAHRANAKMPQNGGGPDGVARLVVLRQTEWPVFGEFFTYYGSGRSEPTRLRTDPLLCARHFYHDGTVGPYFCSSKKELHASLRVCRACYKRYHRLRTLADPPACPACARDMFGQTTPVCRHCLVVFDSVARLRSSEPLAHLRDWSA